MRFTLALVILTCFTGLAHAQTLDCPKNTDRCTLILEMPRAGIAHDASANTFQDLVGKRLKALYPSKVLDPRIDLVVYKDNDQFIWRFTWTCRIVKATPQDADWYFDRRGTLLLGPTPDVARNRVDAEISASQKVTEMRQHYHLPNVPQSFIRDSFSGSNAEGWWYVKEYFLVAPR